MMSAHFLYKQKQKRNCDASQQMGDDDHACGFGCILSVAAWDDDGIESDRHGKEADDTYVSCLGQREQP